jgi:hypothetical protein
VSDDDRKVLHPNFRHGAKQPPLQKQTRALMVYIPQPVYDRIMFEVDHGRAKRPRDLIARALEQYLHLPEGSATAK